MTVARDTTSAARRIQMDVLRQLGGPARLELACRMSDDARSVTLAGIRHRHPDWRGDAVHRELLRLMLGADLSAAVLSSTLVSR
ncbi:MAG: hypothetical protein ABI534_10770 [Chloroflexota bacterium]